MRLNCVILLLLLCVAGSAYTDENLPFVLQLKASEVEVFSDTLRVKARYINPGENTFSIQQTVLILPPNLAKGNERSFNFRTIESNARTEFDLHSKQSVDLEVEIPLLTSIGPSMILLRSREYEVEVDFKYTPEGSEDSSDGSTSFKLGLIAPTWAVMVGAIAGVIAGIVFQIVYSKATRAKVSYTISFWTILLGCISSIIGIVLIRFTTNTPSLPLEINVKDFYGGFALGLVFRFLTDWLATKIGLGPALVKKEEPKP